MDLESADRRVVLALAARKLLSAIEGFIDEHENEIKLVLKMNKKQAREYLFELAIDACQLMKELKGK